MPSAEAFLFVFLDGVGVGDPDAGRNPLRIADLPTLDGLLAPGRFGDSDPVVLAASGGRPAVVYRPLDATLGVCGLPQSGTGHASLLAGFNAPRAFGRHFGPWIPTSLRERFGAENVFRRAVDAGVPARFANAVPDTPELRSFARRPIGPPLAAHGAGIHIGGAASLARGEAVASSFDNFRWRSAFPDAGVPSISVEEAGERLGRIAARGGFTLFAHYDLDLIGHRGGFDDAVRGLRRMDAFLGGVLREYPLHRGTLLVTSDHGNIEETAAGHTRNPVPMLAAGRHAGLFLEVDSIAAVAEAVGGALASVGPT